MTRVLNSRLYSRANPAVGYLQIILLWTSRFQVRWAMTVLFCLAHSIVWIFHYLFLSKQTSSVNKKRYWPPKLTFVWWKAVILYYLQTFTSPSCFPCLKIDGIPSVCTNPLHPLDNRRQRQWWWQWERQKTKRSMKLNTATLSVHHAFLYISLLSLHYYTV